MGTIKTTPGHTWVDDELVTYAKLRAAAKPTVDSDDFNLGTQVDSVKNLLHNPDFDIWQRGASITAATTFTNDDDEYVADRWILLSDGNDIVDVSQEATTVPGGSINALKAVVQTITKKFGFLQILENRDTVRLRGQSISASLQARIGSGDAIGNLRITILEWTGTADAVTSDVVSTWNGAGSEPTYVANWASIKEGGNSALSDSAYGAHTALNATVGSSATNLAVFVYIDDTDAGSADELYLGQTQLEIGDAQTSFGHPGPARDWMNCLYFLEYLDDVKFTHEWSALPGIGDQHTAPVSVFPKRLDAIAVQKVVNSSLNISLSLAYGRSRTVVQLGMSANGEGTQAEVDMDIWVMADL